MRLVAVPTAVLAALTGALLLTGVASAVPSAAHRDFIGNLRTPDWQKSLLDEQQVAGPVRVTLTQLDAPLTGACFRLVRREAPNQELTRPVCVARGDRSEHTLTSRLGKGVRFQLQVKADGKWERGRNAYAGKLRF